MISNKNQLFYFTVQLKRTTTRSVRTGWWRPWLVVEAQRGHCGIGVYKNGSWVQNNINNTNNNINNISEQTRNTTLRSPDSGQRSTSFADSVTNSRKSKINRSNCKSLPLIPVVINGYHHITIILINFFNHYPSLHRHQCFVIYHIFFMIKKN